MKAIRPGAAVVSAALLLCSLFVTSACTHSQLTSAEPLADTSALSHTVAGYADELLDAAAEAEPWITPILVYLAEFEQGEMKGLEFRTKSRESTIRKIETRMAEKNYATANEVSIRDTLRYTMQVPEQPAGHHNQSVAYILALLENVGHTVLAVKNYWPSGDDYSGVNTNLRAPNGLAWELQFHTPQSFELKMSSHYVYEQVRQPDISTETRQALYIQVADEWESVPVPAGILEPGSLHQLEEIILRPSP